MSEKTQYFPRTHVLRSSFKKMQHASASIVYIKNSLEITAFQKFLFSIFRSK